MQEDSERLALVMKPGLKLELKPELKLELELEPKLNASSLLSNVLQQSSRELMLPSIVARHSAWTPTHTLSM